MQFPISDHNRRQKVARLEREIASFERNLEAIGAPQTARERRAATIASACLVRRRRDLQLVLARPGR